MKRILAVLGLSLLLSLGTVGFAQTASHNHSQDNQTITKSDGSVVEMVIAPDGTKTEVRTFKTGDVARITRTTQTDGTRTVIVEYRDSRQVDLTDENDIEQAMDATADTMLMAADKAWSATKKAGEEVADKTEDVADKTVDVTKKAVDVTKKTGKEVADKTEDVVDKSVKVTKEVGKEVADKTEDVVDKTVDTSKEVAVKGVKVTKEAGKEVADKTEDVADKTVDVTKEGAKETVSFSRKVGRGFKKVGGWFKGIFN